MTTIYGDGFIADRMTSPSDQSLSVQGGGGHTPGQWRLYADEKPAAGVYEWRLPHSTLTGMHVLFHAHMRKRWSGHKEEISPAFDYWNGYRALVPAGTQWREANPSVECKTYQYAALTVEGLDHCDCIYCGKTPRLHAVQGGNGGGVIVNGDPNRYNSWWLECCQWGKTPHLADPRELERVRREAIGRAAFMDFAARATEAA